MTRGRSILWVKPAQAYAVSARTHGQNSKGGMGQDRDLFDSRKPKKASKSVDEYGSGLSII